MANEEILSTTCNTIPMVADPLQYIGTTNDSIKLLREVEALLLDANMVLILQIAGSPTETSISRMSTSRS